MSFKSIIDIDINDEKFKAFLESFQRYTEEAEKAPEDWHKVAEAITGAEKRVRGFGSSQGKAFKDARSHVSAAGKSLRGYTGAAGAASASTRKLDQGVRGASLGQRQLAGHLRKSAKEMHGLSIESATAAFGLTDLIGPAGLVAAGITAAGVAAVKTALSLDKLTASKAKNAKEMGMTIAQQQAFKNYGSQLFQNPDATMAAIYKAKVNPADRLPLLNLGITGQQIDKDGVPQLAFLAAKNAHNRLKNTPMDVRESWWQAHTQGMLGGVEQMGLFANTSMKSQDWYQAKYKEYEPKFAINGLHQNRAIRMSQRAGELRGQVTTSLENMASSKVFTAAGKTLISGGREAATDIAAAGENFLRKVNDAANHIASVLHHPHKAVNSTIKAGESDVSKAWNTVVRAVEGAHITKDSHLISGLSNAVGKDYRAVVGVIAGAHITKDRNLFSGLTKATGKDYNIVANTIAGAHFIKNEHLIRGLDNAVSKDWNTAKNAAIGGYHQAYNELFGGKRTGHPIISANYKGSIGRKYHNLGDLQPGGPEKHFTSLQAGDAAFIRLIRAWPKNHPGQDSIASMASTYTGGKPGSKDVRGWIDAASITSGLSPNQRINMNNPRQVLGLARGIASGEGTLGPLGSNGLTQAVMSVLQQIAHNTAQNHIHVHTNTGKVSVAAHAAGR